ncbi:methylated-DNA--[protein]-cysteine S-methyltransferase [uncultured Secundilactobacillus sp.]|uniref:methylated-DNA--[protein]-cysteine S-methyltransferase n=1 Tax=uncultured Secundilactobacillus sp. TaxID=2813935 RepID=UPI00258A1D70|nr:methylated-DNA--[protein]-cysteine S-methyltransferase [uncultured Secundilactobacillus sp.]
MTQIWYQTYDFGDGEQVVAAADAGIAFIGAPEAGIAELTHFFKTATVSQDATELIEQAVQQLREYRAGQRQRFDVATTVLAATPFQRQVWRALTHIPYGQTISYQQLADKINRPNAVRAVASAVAKNPIMEIVACHRVILSTGQTGQYRGGAAMKKRLLAMEKKV